MNPQSSRDALSQYQSFQSSRQKPQDVLKASEERLGIPTATQRQVGLRGAITNTENLLKNVDPSVSGRTQGSLVTDAQKQRLIAMEREPIAGQFTEQSRALEGETANVADLNRRALTESQLAISADDARENSLRGVYDVLYRQEQDQLAREQAAREFAEQQRQFNEQLRASQKGSAGLAGLLGGSGGGSQPAADPLKTRAQEQVAALLNTGNSGVIQKTYDAIAKSAGYGNTYDQLKLQLLQAYGYSGGKSASASKPAPKPAVKTPVNKSIFQGNFAIR
jgi:hypothetical protein